MNIARIDGALGGRQTLAEVPFEKESAPALAVPASHVKWLCLVFLLTLPIVNPWVRGDGVGYYAYLRSALIDHDLNFENDYLAGNLSFVMSRVDGQGHLLPSLYTRTGYVDNHFTVGPAILWAPVVGTVHLAVLLLDKFGAGIPPDGYSRPYMIAMALSTALFGFLALLLAFQTAKRYFAPARAFLATMGIWMASSLPVYMYFNPSWSHAHSAFTVSLFLWYWDRTQMTRTFGQWLVLGLLAGLMGNVYYPNAILLIIPTLEVLWLLRKHRAEAGEPALPPDRALLTGLSFLGVFLIALLPTFITRQIIYGSPFGTGYPSIRTWNWASPALWKVLFSPDHGIWSWTPILFLAAVGLLFVVRHNPLLGVGSLLTFAVFYYFISSYPDWDGISSFGNRFFVSLTPLFVLGLSGFLNASPGWFRSASRAMLASRAAIALLALWNVAFIFQWGTHLVPARGEISWREMLRNQYSVVPLRVEHSLETYFLHRGDMMQHIEQEDIEQQQQTPRPELQN